MQRPIIPSPPSPGCVPLRRDVPGGDLLPLRNVHRGQQLEDGDRVHRELHGPVCDGGKYRVRQIVEYERWLLQKEKEEVKFEKFEGFDFEDHPTSAQTFRGSRPAHLVFGTQLWLSSE